MKEDRIKVLAGAGLLGTAAIWGFAFVVVKNSLDVIPPAYMLAVRFTIAAFVLAAVCWRRLRNLSRRTVWAGAVVGFWLFASYLLQTIGCQYTTAGKNAFLTSAYVIIVPFLYWIFAGRKPDAYCITAAVLAVTGIGLLSLQGDLSMNVGDILTLACAIGFAMHMIYIDKYTQEWDPVVLTVLQLAFAAVFSWVASPVLDGGFPSGVFSADMIVSMLYLGIFSTMLAFLLQNVCQKYTSPDVTSLLLSTEAVFGAFFSILLLGEKMDSRMAVGCVLLFLAVILAETKLSFLSKWAAAFFPDDYLDSAYEIAYEELYREGYRGILFDIDNTLVPHGEPADARAVRLFEHLREIGFKSCFLSNNQRERVESFNHSVGEIFIEDAHKPSIVNYHRAMERLGTDAGNTLFIGDQIFTDIYGAKRAGIRNILVKPIHPKEEIQIVLKRYLEKIVLHFYEKRRGGKRKMRHIVLIGFMGSGKTETGKRLAEEMGLVFLEVDKKITSEMKMSVADIFNRFGEVFFRALETKAIKELEQEEQRMVISVGGGLPMQEQNHKYLKEMGIVVYLKGSVDTLKKRLHGDRTRPLLQGADLEGKIRRMLAEREPVYEKLADVTVVTSDQSFGELVRQIREEVEEYEKNHMSGVGK